MSGNNQLLAEKAVGTCHKFWTSTTLMSKLLVSSSAATLTVAGDSNLNRATISNASTLCTLPVIMFREMATVSGTAI